MPSFAIPKFTVLLEPLWVSAVFLLLSTGPNLDSTKWKSLLKRFYLKFYSRNYSQLFAWNKGCCFSAMPVPAFSDMVKQSVLCYNKCVKPMQKNADAKEVAYGTQCNFKARRVLR